LSFDSDKILSPEHLLKKSFANDSNTLNKEFYNELLHIIGLEEKSVGGKKIIDRKDKNREDGSLLENTINALKIRYKLRSIDNPKQFGNTEEEQLYNLGLELSITWLNRVLFLKLLEGQLIKYHKGNLAYTFLNSQKVKTYSGLHELFFEVLAIKTKERSSPLIDKYKYIPYLNSSLFEISDLENKTIQISELKVCDLSLFPHSVLKNKAENKQVEKKNALDYLLEFLSAYNFSSDSSAKIQTEKKTIINSSVLGLIFEKINGYRDGSIFTPGFITMDMSRKTIRMAVIQKFNEYFRLNGIREVSTFKELHNSMDKVDIKTANAIINSLKICDPAVGSGHFLVSVLNELIVIKYELGILVDKEGNRLIYYEFVVENDELIVTYEKGIFEYNYLNKESQRVQETLFHEKQTIIENCLFGVDINPNSVKICRLRLWIELLKNTYYKAPDYTELETLPNIDINIKCGNSLISRFALDADISIAFKKNKNHKIESYRNAVKSYRNAQGKEEKWAMEALIHEIKIDLESEIAANDKRLLRLIKAKGDLTALTTQVSLFERTKPEQAVYDKEVKFLTNIITQLENELEEIRSNRIYENAFEWRFEFPDVLNDEGDFIGFDVVIGNPPYVFTKEASFSDLYKSAVSDFLNANDVNTDSKGLNIQTGKINLFGIFLIRSFEILKKDALLNFIIPNNILRATTYEAIRKFLLKKTTIIEIVDLGSNIFPEATVSTVIFCFKKQICANNTSTKVIKDIVDFENKDYTEVILNQYLFEKNISFTFNIMLKPEEFNIIKKIETSSNKLDLYFKHISPGIDGDKEKYVKKSNVGINLKPLLFGKDFGRYKINFNNNYIEYNREKLNRARDETIFLSKKIIIQRISGGNMPLTVTVDYERYYTFNSVNNLVLNDNIKIPIEFFAGLLNSKLLNWYYSVMYSNKSTLTVNISKTFLSELPIKTDSNERISEIVQNIIDSKLKGIDTTELERAIDQMVYQLYGLTQEEIEIVEKG